jgi:hypothetical protein
MKVSNDIVTCIIDNGFYTHDTLPNAVIKALNGSDKLNEGFSFDYSDVTRHLTIINFFSEFRIVFDDQLSTCSELLGYTAVNTDYAKEHLSPGLINLEPIHMLNVSLYNNALIVFEEKMDDFFETFETTDFLSGKLKVDIVFELKSIRNRDLDNMLKSLFDSLEGRIFENDNQIFEINCKKIHYCTQDSTIINIFEM